MSTKSKSKRQRKNEESEGLEMLFSYSMLTFATLVTLTVTWDIVYEMVQNSQTATFWSNLAAAICVFIGVIVIQRTKNTPDEIPAKGRKK